ncbi:MAG TPA: potassium-transporting ATPase subunit KdpA [Lacipirellulaceae bacterium]|jgi:K+-transporting ATPase ATPase A chain|nr:potassium-transporting ATPase subunit KdpA [Lacipirellulaceae bacterium]
MTANDSIQIALYFAVLALLAKPLGAYMARVFEGKRCGFDRALGWLERGIYRVAGVNSHEEMGWRKYTVAVLLFNAVGFLAVYALLRLQGVLPLNPQQFPGNSPDLAFDTAASFATNTNWQSYGGESTMSYLSQMLALTVQNFVSAASGIAVLVALIRGLARRTTSTIGNFWYDLVRSTLYVLLPLSLVLALVLVSQGVIQNFSPYDTAHVLQPTKAADGATVDTQSLAMGPAASQVAIKQLGTNGGGFFNVNSAHPFENPTPLSNFLELLAILLIPAALCYTFGVMVRDTRQGWAILAAMYVILVPLTIFTAWQEQRGVPQYDAMGVDQQASASAAGGNMEGKETRFGIVNSALWSTATTGASNGSVNAMHDSFTPLAGMVTMWLIQLGEIVFGGVGSGLYGMLMFVIVAVFVAGLMVGRTPEYLGKKIEAYEMKMASLVILIPPLLVLGGTAIAICGPGLNYAAPDSGEIKSTLNNPGAHGFSEVLYAFSSASNNNGSAFAGLSANVPFYNIGLGIVMLAARYWLMIPTLAIAGSLARKKYTPSGAGTLPTHRPLFVVMLVSTILLVGALTFVPALALGPVVEQLQMLAGK